MTDDLELQKLLVAINQLLDAKQKRMQIMQK